MATDLFGDAPKQINWRPQCDQDWVWFVSRYCDQCKSEHKCAILADAINESNSPAEWVRDIKLKMPTCTAFEPIEGARCCSGA